MDITGKGALSYVRGYMLIIAANLYYLLQRMIFRDMCSRFYETRQKSLYPAVIVTEEEVIKNKPIKFVLLRKVLALMIWMLVVGFIQVWRGLFATFDYIVDLLYVNHGVNKVLSSIVFQLIVGVTLAFTQRNNAVNLCPTHKIYKYDELEEMDGIFSLHIFDNLLNSGDQASAYQSDDVVISSNSSSKIEEFKAPDITKNQVYGAPKRKFTPLNSGFDLPQYTGRKISGSLHRSSTSSSIASFQLRKSSQVSKTSSAFSEQVLSTPSFDEMTPVRKIGRQEFGAGERKLSMSVFMNEPAFTAIIEEAHHDNVNKSEEEIDDGENGEELEAIAGYINEGYNTSAEIINEAETSQCSPSLTSSRRASPTDLTLMQHIQRTTAFRKSMKRSVSEFNKEPTDSAMIDTNATSLNVAKQKEEEENLFKYNHCRICMFVSILTYAYTIHHRQVFLHIFGGMFWSTSWKLFDLATASFFTQTASDLPGLALIAILCHCLNHLVLFRFKEEASGVYWKTFWEFFCGLFSVWLWAPVWYIWDIIADATGMYIFFLFLETLKMLLFL